MTRVVSVSVERSPSGGFGWFMQCGPETLWRVGSAFVALGWVRQHLERLGAGEEERGRVIWLLIKELEWKRRACVAAEVPATEGNA